MYVSCSTLVCTLDAYPAIEDVIAKTKALGFQALDLAAFHNWQNVNPATLVTDGGNWQRRFADAVQAAGMRVSSLNCGFSKPLNDPDPAAFAHCKQEYLALVDLAEAVNCPNLTVQPGYPIEGYAFNTLFAASQRHLSELAALSQDRSITLSVEGHQGSILEDPADALRMMEALWPAVGFTYDPSHWAMQAIPLPETAPLLPFTRHVHVRNAALDAMQATMAEGIVDFAWLINALQENSYADAVAIEYFSGFDRDFTETLALRDLMLSLGVNP